MKKPVAIILVVVVLLAAGVGGWLWYQSHQDRGLTLYGNVDIRSFDGVALIHVKRRQPPPDAEAHVHGANINVTVQRQAAILMALIPRGIKAIRIAA